MAPRITKITQEQYMRAKETFAPTMSIAIAKVMAKGYGRKTIYRLPNGLYAVKKK